MTDIEGFLTIYGHSDNLLNNKYIYFHIWKCTADLEVHCRFSFIACLAAILKSETVSAVFSGHFNSLEETFHD